MTEEQGFRLGDLKSVVRRRLPVMAAMALAVFLLSVVIAAILPNLYTASATLLVEPQSISKKLVESGVAESDLNNRLHLMTMQILSRPRLSKIIDDLEALSRGIGRDDAGRDHRDDAQGHPRGARAARARDQGAAPQP